MLIVKLHSVSLILAFSVLRRDLRQRADVVAGFASTARLLRHQRSTSSFHLYKPVLAATCGTKLDLGVLAVRHEA